MAAILGKKLGMTQVFAEDNRLFWHPAAGGIAALHGEQKVTVFPAIGYTHADQSHFTSRHYWEVGATTTQLQTGWLGRYLDVVGTPDNPLQGLTLDVAPGWHINANPASLVTVLFHLFL